MSAWRDEDWGAFAALLRRAWPGEFSPEDSRAYRVLLDDTDPDAALAAMKRLLHRGVRFRPSVAELLAEARADPSRPTFDEAYRMIFGARGVLRARAERREYATPADRRRAETEAALDRARELHPLIESFVARRGVEALRALPLDDPEWGLKHRRDLERCWAQHVEAFEGREVAALAAGGPKELARLDPLAALNLDRRAGLPVPEEEAA